MSKITLELSETQVLLLWELVNNVNWNGRQIEDAFELKQLLKETIEKNSQTNPSVSNSK